MLLSTGSVAGMNTAALRTLCKKNMSPKAKKKSQKKEQENSNKQKRGHVQDKRKTVLATDQRHACRRLDHDHRFALHWCDLLLRCVP